MNSDATIAAMLLHDAERMRSLDEAFRWAIAQSPRVEPRDVIIQDEYSHDVLFRGADGSCLVFDTT